MISKMEFVGVPKVIIGGSGSSDDAIQQSKDAARLDFIEKKHASIYAARENGAISHWVFVDETAKSRTGVIGNTLREAVDAAMKAK